VYLWGGTVDGKAVLYDATDVAALRSAGVGRVAARVQLGDVPMGREGRRTRGMVQGDEPIAWDAGEVRLVAGRALDPLDAGHAVAVVGAEVARELFPDADAVGGWIVVRNVALRVVGVSRSDAGGESGDRADRTVRVPLDVASSAFGTGPRVDTVLLVGDADPARATAILADRHGVPAGRLGLYDTERFVRRIHGLFAAIRGLTWLVGAATVASGAVGVGNVLVVAVRERTAEIGLRRAIGATRAAVIGLILREAVLLVGVAGVGGLAAGAVLVTLGRWAIGPDHPWLGQPELRPGAMAVLVALLAAASVLAATMPAARAAAIRPAVALRGE
jgi:putative ABC transport system permease protein